MQTEDLKVIMQVAKLKSITAAANSLNMHLATASAAIKRVEAELGTELFIRTTRQLKISNAGKLYLPQCEQALDMLNHAQQILFESKDNLKGEIKIAISSDLGRNTIIPWLDEFLKNYPKIDLKCNISDSNIDFYQDSIDMALRYGSPSSASMSGFFICNVPRIICASPSYIEEYGNPQTICELKKHNALFYQLNNVLQNEWELTQIDKQVKVKLEGNRATNDGDLVRRWCVNGQGIAIKSCLDMADDLTHKRVIPVMNEFIPTPTKLWLVAPSRHSITPAMRLLRDFFRDKTVSVLNQLVAEKFIDKNQLL